jgi:hypothetical protein
MSAIEMGKTKTTLNLDEKLWNDFQIYSLKVTGAARNASLKVEDALREYMQNHPATKEA